MNSCFARRNKCLTHFNANKVVCGSFKATNGRANGLEVRHRMDYQH